MRAAQAAADNHGRGRALFCEGRSGRAARTASTTASAMAGERSPAQELYFARGRTVAERRSGYLQRDESGTWRAAFGISLA